MGLDQYAYVAAKARAREEYYEAKYSDTPSAEPVAEPYEIAYWRKHPNLQGWMEALWIEKGKPMPDGGEPPEPDGMGQGFNGIELELTREDIDRLEQDVLENNLPPTTGFFFGNPSDSHYKDHDLKFVREARAQLFLGMRVFYNSSW